MRLQALTSRTSSHDSISPWEPQCPIRNPGVLCPPICMHRSAHLNESRQLATRAPAYQPPGRAHNDPSMTAATPSSAFPIPHDLAPDVQPPKCRIRTPAAIAPAPHPALEKISKISCRSDEEAQRRRGGGSPAVAPHLVPRAVRATARCVRTILARARSCSSHLVAPASSAPAPPGARQRRAVARTTRTAPPGPAQPSWTLSLFAARKVCSCALAPTGFVSAPSDLLMLLIWVASAMDASRPVWMADSFVIRAGVLKGFVVAMLG